MKMIVVFEKGARLRHIGHLDLMRAMQRALRRSDLPLRYSQGFNPHIEMSILVPLSTGYESLCDLCDLELTCDECPADFVSRLNAVLPQGMRVRWAGDAARPVAQVQNCAYTITLPAGDVSAMEELFQKGPVLVEKRSKRGKKEVDVRDYIRAIAFETAGERTLCRCTLAAGNDPLNPMYITRALKDAGLVPRESAAAYVRTAILDENCRIFQE